MNWNSISSRVFDVLFGVLPALYFAFWAVLSCYLTVAAPNIEQNLGALALFAVSLSGLAACLSLIYVSLTRENTRSRTLHIVLLAMGILVTLILLVAPSPIGYIDNLKIVFPFFAISLVLVAAKQIFLLSRVEKVIL